MVGRLDEICLSVSMGGPLENRPVRSASFLEQSKLCVLGGKPDKRHGVGVQDQKCPAALGPLESRCVISEACRPLEGSWTHQKTAALHLRPPEGLGRSKAPLAQGSVVGKDRPETKSQPGVGFHRAAGVPTCCAQQQETSVWVPNSSPLAMDPQGSREVVPGQKSGVHPGSLAVMTPGGLRGSSSPPPQTGGIGTGSLLPFQARWRRPPGHLTASPHIRDHDKESERLSPTEEGALVS